VDVLRRRRSHRTVILGRAFDATGSYASLLLLLAAALGIMALTNFLLPRYSDGSTT
jgi:hypothetical protein